MKKIGLVRGYSYTPEFWEFAAKYMTYQEITNDEILFKMLNEGRFDYILAELGNGIHTVKKLGLDNIIIPLKSNPIKFDGLYVIFTKKNISQSFVDEFSAELKKFKQDPLYQEIYDEYFSVK